MSLLSRLKRLWELSGRYDLITEGNLVSVLHSFKKDLKADAPEIVAAPSKPTGSATVVEANPLDVFGNEPGDPNTEGDIQF